MAYSRSGEERHDIQAEKETLRKNQVWATYQPDMEEGTGARMKESYQATWQNVD